VCGFPRGELVDDLRVSLLYEPIKPAEGVLEIVSRAGRETGLEQYHEHLDYLDEIRVLLDTF
jgi:hypothetical protein